MEKSASQIAEQHSPLGLTGNTSEVELVKGRLSSRGSLTGIAVTIDLRYCKGCGICAAGCPTRALEMAPEEGELREAIERSCAEEPPSERLFMRDRPLSWQELPQHAGLIVYDRSDSDNRTGAWRVGEVVVADADKCVLCGLCYHYCPEDIIRVRYWKAPAVGGAGGERDVAGRD